MTKENSNYLVSPPSHGSTLALDNNNNNNDRQTQQAVVQSHTTSSSLGRRGDGVFDGEHSQSTGFSDFDVGSDNDSFRYVQSSSGAWQQGTRLVRRENRIVSTCKLLMILLLSFSAGLLALATYLFLTQQIQNNFEQTFEDYATEVIQVSQVNALNLFTAYKNLASTITSYAIGSNSTWPFVTISLYEAMAIHVKEILVSRYILYAPFVQPHQREQWETYALENQQWINQSYAYYGLPPTNRKFFPKIFRLNFTNGGTPYPDNIPPNPIYAPIWHAAPIDEFLPFINYNGFDGPVFPIVYPELLVQRDTITSYALDLTGYIGSQDEWPQVVVTEPIFDSFDDKTSNIVAVLSTFLPWHVFFENIVPQGASGMTMVVQNCRQEFSYRINGPVIQYLGEGDLSEQLYRHLVIEETNTTWIPLKGCPYKIRLYPSSEFRKEFDSNGPVFYTVAVLVVFFTTVIVIVVHDCLVARSQRKFEQKVDESNAIVDSFIPSDVRARLLDEQAKIQLRQREQQLLQQQNPIMNRLNNTISNSQRDDDSSRHRNKPIADLHPHCTIMIADIADFTSWSSAREPPHVIALLEAIYAAFDKVAKLRGVYKVETTGDCYVAAAGLPQPRDDHAIVMAKFAHACVLEFKKLVLLLETYLGPNTSDLGIRFGLHSGPVTAGVLRGNIIRFQVFGQAVKMAEFIQSSGAKNKIHLSHATATLLQQNEKTKKWVIARKELVDYKDSEKIQTYWLNLPTTEDSKGQKNNNASRDFNQSTTHSPTTAATDQKARLVDWNVELLSRLLKQIVATRDPASITGVTSSPHLTTQTSSSAETVLEEVKEIIELPSHTAQYRRDPTTVVLDLKVFGQLRAFVEKIASMYRDNHFHSFQHACHVSQSLSKLLSRIVTPDSVDYVNMTYKRKGQAIELHEFTYGIASDPITQFACAFSALIHDVDHPGVPNAQLIKEDTYLATLYKNKSVAEQNSVDLAWDLLMQPEYSDLRRVIFITQEELDRFRQLVVNSVMATDIVDKELGALRKKRWDTAFAKRINTSTTTTKNSNNNDISTDPNDGNRKATIVIEHLIQAADVAHTMQHWNVYLKWNERFFKEMYQAYLDGRADKDPSIGWYEGEIGFFDFYIIPLAKKLESCGVFGVSSDECLSYAVANRHEWSVKGKDIVKRYLDAFERKN